MNSAKNRWKTKRLRHDGHCLNLSKEEIEKKISAEKRVLTVSKFQTMVFADLMMN